jgi:hypothetical protein
VGAEGVSWIGDGDPLTIRFADVCAARQLESGSLRLLPHDGRWMELDADQWIAGARILARVENALPPEVVIPARKRASATAVESVARAQLRRRRGVRQELRALPGILQDGELVEVLAVTGRMRWPSLAVLTDRRLVEMWGSDVRLDLPRGRAAEVSLRRGLRGSRLTVRDPSDVVLRITRLRPRRRAVELARRLAGGA